MIDFIRRLKFGTTGSSKSTINGPLLILAGAGTGKTKTINYKISLSYKQRWGIEPIKHL